MRLTAVMVSVDISPHLINKSLSHPTIKFKTSPYIFIIKSSSLSFSFALVNTSERSLYVLMLKMNQVLEDVMYILKIKKIVLICEQVL